MRRNDADVENVVQASGSDNHWGVNHIHTCRISHYIIPEFPNTAPMTFNYICTGEGIRIHST